MIIINKLRQQFINDYKKSNPLNYMPENIIKNFKYFQRIHNSIFNKNLVKIQKATQQYIKRTKTLYPVQYKYSKHIAQAGWTWIDQEPITGFFHKMHQRLTLNKNQLNKLFSKILCANNNTLLNKDFDDLSKRLDSGHAKQIRLIKSLINQNKCNCIICFDTLFTILEYLFYTNGINSGKKTFTESTAAKGKKNTIKFSNKYKKFTTLFLWTDYIVIDQLYSTKHGDEYKNKPYGRNTVMHGRFNPNNFTFLNFIKLVLLCRNVSFDLKSSKEFMNISN